MHRIAHLERLEQHSDKTFDVLELPSVPELLGALVVIVISLVVPPLLLRGADVIEFDAE